MTESKARYKQCWMMPKNCVAEECMAWKPSVLCKGDGKKIPDRLVSEARCGALPYKPYEPSRSMGPG